jgi:hypothetical protein
VVKSRTLLDWYFHLSKTMQSMPFHVSWFVWSKLSHGFQFCVFEAWFGGDAGIPNATRDMLLSWSDSVLMDRR